MIEWTDKKDIEFYSKNCKTLSELLSKYATKLNTGAAFLHCGDHSAYEKSKISALERAAEFLKKNIEFVPKKIKRDIEL